MADLPFQEHGEVGRTRSHLDQNDTQLLLVLCQRCQRTRERREHEILRFIAGFLDRLADVVRWRRSDCDQIHLGFQPGANHANRIANAGVLVDRVLLRNGVEQFSLARDRLCAGHLVRAVHIGTRDLVAIHGHNALTSHSLHVLARDSDVERLDFQTRHSLRITKCLRDRACGLFDV